MLVGARFFTMKEGTYKNEMWEGKKEPCMDRLELGLLVKIHEFLQYAYMCVMHIIYAHVYMYVCTQVYICLYVYVCADIFQFSSLKRPRSKDTPVAMSTPSTLTLDSNSRPRRNHGSAEKWLTPDFLCVKISLFCLCL